MSLGKLHQLTVVCTTLAASLVLATIPTPTRAATAASAYAAHAEHATNARRVGHGIHRVNRRSPCLRRFAIRQARRMRNQRRLFHQDLSRVMRVCHLRMAGEVVASGFPSGYSVVNDGWMKSAEHRHILLDPGYHRAASGARRGNGVWYISEVFGTHT